MTEVSCTTCGSPLQTGDRYCGHCGAPASAVRSAFATADEPGVGDRAGQVDGPAGADRAAETTAVSVIPARPTTANPIAVAQMPTEPPPAGVVTDGRRRRSGRLLVGIVTVVAVALVAALGLALISARSDLDSARARVAQLSVSTSTVPGETGAIGPVFPVDNGDVTALQTQLDQINAALTQAKADLAAERAGRAADAAAATAAATDASTQAATDAATAKAAADAQAAQLAQLQALFPLTTAAVAAADPTGAYTVALTAGSCTLTDCTAPTSMTLAFSDPSTITGDRVTGTVTTTGVTSSLTGTVPAALSPLCAGVSAPATYALSLQVISVQAPSGSLQVAEEAGTYAETIASGACAGQLRSYTIDLTRQ